MSRSSLYSALLSLLQESPELRAAGLILVTQEGSKAGQIAEYDFFHSEGDRRHIAPQISALRDALFTGIETLHENEAANRIRALPLNGPFSTTIGYLWYLPAPSFTTNGHPPYMLEITSIVLSHIESSKKSRFHEVFSKDIRSLDKNTIFQTVANTITKGLFADLVLVWQLNNNILTSINHPDFDVPVSGSTAGAALRNGTITIHDIATHPPDKLFYKNFFKEHGLNAAFFFPIRNLSDKAQPKDLGVCGVFYKRPYGTTDVDKELCQYAIGYYEPLWELTVTNRAQQAMISTLADYRVFLQDAIRCLVDFHDITNIQFGLASSISNAMAFSHNNANAASALQESSREVSKLKKLIDRHSKAMKVARTYAELLINDEIVPIELVNVADLIHEEVDRLEDIAAAARATLQVHCKLRRNVHRIRRTDLERCVRNLVSNAIRSVQDRSTGKGEIVVTAYQRSEKEIALKVRDNGPGIEPGKEELIFEPLYTTQAEKGGKGLGLTIVRTVAKKYGRSVRVSSIWGRYAEFEVSIDTYTS